MPVSFGAIGSLPGALIGAVHWTVRLADVPVDVGAASGPLAVLRTDRANTLAAASIAALCVDAWLRGFGFAGIAAAAFLAVCHLRAWGRWVILVRGRLALTGRLPWAPAAFLEEAHRRGVLRQSGAYYRFRHLRLRDHLAAHDRRQEGRV
ncbi:hypothetical protein GCM10020358_31090 [Amorphoplanes nipponensis]|uniref:Uncharacterized protein n=1 Tax=Actinoplanes nipponensis TaxID=135950 RepID=A0A919JPV5_9ACTN|nr:hypothetical protein Ani05nite_43030 [Actinoplanes nipponensis]